MQTNLEKYDNSFYKPTSKLKGIVWYFTNALFFTNPFFSVVFIKIIILKCFGCKMGKGVMIKPKVNIKYPWLLEIGSHVWIGENVWIDNLAKVTIDNNVCISQGAMLLCGNHNYKKSTFDLMVNEIHIKEGAWVGAKSIICPGVVLNSHSILSVGSVANKDLEAYSIYQGNPAVKVRERTINE